MIPDKNYIKNTLSLNNLKVTPQRIAILEAIYDLDNHPTADDIIEYLKDQYPTIAIGTVYKVLDVLTSKCIIKKVTTDNDIMRYDGRLERHHHMYCTECDEIRDFKDEKLDKLLNDYLKSADIKGFVVKDFVLQIKGTFEKHH